MTRDCIDGHVHEPFIAQDQGTSTKGVKMRNVSMYHANVTLTSSDAAYVIITNLTCFASMSGCLIVIGLYLMYPDIRTTARKLLVCLSFANFVQCVAGLLQVHRL